MNRVLSHLSHKIISHFRQKFRYLPWQESNIYVDGIKPFRYKLVWLLVLYLARYVTTGAFVPPSLFQKDDRSASETAASLHPSHGTVLYPGFSLPFPPPPQLSPWYFILQASLHGSAFSKHGHPRTATLPTWWLVSRGSTPKANLPRDPGSRCKAS